MNALVERAVGDFARSWRRLFTVDIIYKAIAFVLLAPLVGVLFRVLMAASGPDVLSDQDILFFFLGPAGWVCFIIAGALWLGIVALEQASLLAVIGARLAKRDIGLYGALRFACSNSLPVVRVAVRLIGQTLLRAAPFLAAVGVVCLALLTEYDINYYLKEKPPAFWTALSICAVFGAALLGMLLRLFAGWLFALPIVLFENVKPSDALRVSRERATGHRVALSLWILGWALAAVSTSAIASAAVVGLGRLIVPRSSNSPQWMVISVGGSLLLWGVVTLAVNLLGTTTFSTMLLNLYRHFGGGSNLDVSRLSAVDMPGSGAAVLITRRRILVACIAGVVIALLVGFIALRSVRLEDHVEIMAHRGSSKAAPENTLASVKQAIEDGADWVEIDVQETADGEVVVVHDSDFMKLAGVDLKVWDATREDLKDIDIGSWFDPAFQHERVPTLREVLALCRGKMGVNIELKYYGHDVQLEQRVADIVDEQGMSSNVVAMSLELGGVHKMKSLRPAWKGGLLMSVTAGDLSKLAVDFLAVNASFANRRFVRAAHASGRKVYVWTVNDPFTMCTMVGRGVDGLITDQPALARSVLEMRSRMSVPERWMMELAGLFGVRPEIGEQ